MRGVARFLLILLLAGFAAPSLADAPKENPLAWGVWRNPKNSVHLEIKPCGGSACGYVVWANADAKADAMKGGTKQLVGTQLFRDLQPDKAGVLRGRVFVPDLNMTFSGKAVPDGQTLKATGCLLGRVLCKSQTWVRVS